MGTGQRLCPGALCGPAGHNHISQLPANARAEPLSMLWSPEAFQTCYGLPNPQDYSCLLVPFLPTPIQAPNPHAPTPQSESNFSMLTVPGCRLCCHGCHHCPPGPQQLWGHPVKISQLSESRCGFLLPHPPRPQQQGFPQSHITTHSAFEKRKLKKGTGS